MELDPYLFFDGNCEQALDFYKNVFGGQVTSLNRFAGSPMESHVAPGDKNKILHANFKSPTLEFMACDDMPGTKRAGSRVALCLGTRDPVDAKRIFERLADGGSVSMLLQKTFWGATFGTVTDKFGIDWMMNCEKA